MTDARARSMWIFGYGSLIWRPDFDYTESRLGFINGWSRRFWQGSTDHRGIPGSPGRVVTLVRCEGASTWGRAFRLKPESTDAIIEYLDVREQGGYEQHALPVFDAAGVVAHEALVYVATPENPDYLGDAPALEIARQIMGSVGPSGPNIEYFERLHQALQDHGVHDQHLQDIAAAVRTVRSTTNDF